MLKLIVIRNDAPRMLAVREFEWHHKRTNRHSITFEWSCRGCCRDSKVEVFDVDKAYVLELGCSHCGLIIKRETHLSNWECYIECEDEGVEGETEDRRNKE